MASGPEDSVIDDTSSSLGDSTYDFLDDKSGFTTDDEDASNMTKSVSSTGVDDPAFPAIHESQGTAPTIMPLPRTTPCNQDDDVVTGEDQEDTDDEHEDIKLDEPFRVNANAARSVEGSHTLRIFDEHEVKEMKNIVGIQTPLSQLKATVRQTMAGHTISLAGPFKVFYVGDQGAKDTIIQKIGSALTASLPGSPTRTEKQGSSRFNVVPISSFGETRSPEVLLVDSLGIEIKIDHCRSATHARKEDNNDSIALHLSDGTLLTSSWSSHNSAFTVAADHPGWELPQLAIFYLSDAESIEARQTRRFARSFMSRHKVSCLVITQSQLWTRTIEAMTLDYLTPHLCLESTGMENVRPRVIKRLPIDLATFLNLDAVQVNRNLAWLADASLSETKFKDLSSIQKSVTARHGLVADETGRCSSEPVDHRYSPWVDFLIQKARPLIESPVSALFLLALAFSCLGLVPYIAYSGSGVANAPVFHHSHGSSPEHLTTAIKTSTAHAESGLSSQLPSINPLQTASTHSKSTSHANTDLASYLLESHALTPNNSAKFKVHVVGDRHVVLRPPHWFMRYRKAPKLIFNITRQNKVVEHELSMLFEGVYALRVSREEAHGLLDVSVRTTTKPKINETFQVDFGSSWLRVAGWKDIARTLSNSVQGDIELVQTGLSILRVNTNTGVQKYTKNVVESVHAIRQDLEAVKAKAFNRATITTDLILAQTKNLSRIVSSNLNQRRALLSKQLSLHGQHVRSDLGQYAGNPANALKRGFSTVSRGIRYLNFRAAGKGIKQLRQHHMRSTQKKALKAWWKIAGVPKQAPGRGPTHGTQHKPGQRQKRVGKQ